MSVGNDPRNFLARMAEYHAPHRAAPAAAPAHHSYGWMPVFTFGGGSGCSRSVNVITSDRGALSTLRQHDAEDRAEGRASAAAVLGGLAVLILSGGIAFALRGVSNTKRELEEARQFRDGELHSMRPEERVSLAPIVKKHIEILESKAFHQRNISILTGAALASAAAAFLGGMFAVQPLVTAAVIAGVATGAFAIFTAVWYATDDAVMPVSMQERLQALCAPRS